MANLNPKKVLLYVGITVLTISIPAAVFLATQPRTTNWQGRASQEKTAFLYLWPAKMTIASCPANVSIDNCQQKKVEVTLNSEKKVGNLDLVLKYDPTKIHLVDNLIYPGVVDNQKNTQYLPFEYYSQRTIDSKKGIIRLQAQNSLKQGKSIFATFWIVGLTQATTEIQILNDNSYLDSTKVWDESNQNNILKSVEPLEININ